MRESADILPTLLLRFSGVVLAQRPVLRLFVKMCGFFANLLLKNNIFGLKIVVVCWHFYKFAGVS